MTIALTKNYKGEFENMGYLKRIISLFLTFALLLTGFINGIKPVYAEATAFQNEDKAKMLYEMGLFKGTSTSGFSPDLGSKLDRQQGITMIIRLLGLSDVAEALTQGQVDAALMKFADGTAINPSLKKAVAYATINKLVIGDGVNIMPDKPMSGKDFATLILRNLGYKDNEFKYDTACSDLADKKGISQSDAAKLNNKELIRDDMVSMAFSSLKAVDKDGKTVIERLVATNPKLADLAEKAGIYSKPEATPTATPTITPSATPSATPTTTAPTGGSSNTGTKPRRTPTPAITPTPSATPTPEVTPTPIPEKELNFEASAIGAYKIQLAFNKTINFNTANVSIKKSNMSTVTYSTYSADNDTKIIVVMPSKITAGEYNITVTGLEDKTITKSLSTENERVDRIAYLSTKAYLNPNNKQVLTAYTRVFNQYSEDVTKTYGPMIYFSASKGFIYFDYAFSGKILINNSYDYLPGEKIDTTAVYSDTMSGIFCTAQCTLTVGEMGVNETNPLDDMSEYRMRFSKSYALQNISDNAGKSIIAGVHIYDKSYNDITRLYYNDPNIKIVTDKGTAGAMDVNGNFIITALSGFQTGESVALSVYHKTLGVEVSDILTVRNGISLYEAEVKGIYNKDNLELSTVNKDTNKFYLLFNAKNEYGFTVTDYTYFQNAFIVQSSNPSLVNISGQFIKLNINGTDTMALEILPSPAPAEMGGNVHIFVVSKYSGVVTEYTVTVKEGPKINVVDIRPPDITLLGEKVIIPYNAYDDNGNIINTKEFLFNTVLTTSLGQIYFRTNDVTGVLELILDLTTYDLSKPIQDVHITATTKATVAKPSVTRNLYLKAFGPTPESIVGLNGSINKNIFADGGPARIPVSYIFIKDQFGRDFDFSKFLNPNYRINLKILNTDVISFSNAYKLDTSTLLFNGIVNSVYIYPNNKGKAQIDITIEKCNEGASQYFPISHYICEFNVVDRQDIVSYSFKELPVIYADSKAFYGYQAPVGNIPGTTQMYDSHAVIPEIEGILSDGTKIVIPYKNKAGALGENYTVYADNTLYCLELQSSSLRIKVPNPKDISFPDGVTDKEYPITASVKGYSGNITVTGKIKFSNIAPQAANLALRPESELINTYSALDPVTNIQPVPLNSYKRMPGNVVLISFDDFKNLKSSRAFPNNGDLVTALTNRVVKMTDQYGKPILASSSSMSSTLISYTYYNDPTKVYNYAFENVDITDIWDMNGSMIPIDMISAGSFFTVSATTENGINITFIVCII